MRGAASLGSFILTLAALCLLIPPNRDKQHLSTGSKLPPRPKVRRVSRGGAGGAGRSKQGLSAAVMSLQMARSPEAILSSLSEHGYDETFRTSHFAQGLLRLSKYVMPISANSIAASIRRDERLNKAWEAVLRRIELGDSKPEHVTDILVSLALLTTSSSSSSSSSSPPPSPSSQQVEGVATSLSMMALPSRLPRVLLGAASADPSRLDGQTLTSLVWAARRLGLSPPHGALKIESSLPFTLKMGVFDNLTVDSLLDEVDFKTEQVELQGKKLSERRQTAWQSSTNKPFRYSGKVMSPSPFTPLVQEIRDRIFKLTGVPYDCALLNLYPDGTSGMRFHSDPDQGIHWSTNTAVVSVGDTRLFVMREMDDHSKRHQFYVTSGDVLIMHGDCQQRYQHSIRTEEPGVRAAGVALDGSSSSSSSRSKHQRWSAALGPRISIVFKQSLEEEERWKRRGALAE
mmetsp:Transcript_21035/g.42328  ORF Transcript_21035/g.42328 Transcript_21035/m.42328 type:complete len:458 (+) Transcript_21035:48-1421(+)